MKELKTKKSASTGSNKISEKTLRARAVSRGVAIGQAVCLHGNKRQFYRINLKSSQIERELRRFRSGLRLANQTLKKIISQKETSETQKQIFESHLLILEDSSLRTKIEAAISEKKVNSEWAVKLVTDHYFAIYKDIQDEHLRERRIDLEDITERILMALGGSRNGRKRISLAQNSIIVAKEINPSTLVELGQKNLRAVITENGGWTSHTFILARELSLPAVTGAKGILRRVKTGDTLVIDGYHGNIIINPSKATLQQYQTTVKVHSVKNENTFSPGAKLQTLDGRQIRIHTNLDILKDYSFAKKVGAEGVGLFRSEFLFNQNQDFPTEHQQIEIYREIAEISGDDSVKIRTFDLTVGQLGNNAENPEKNPALGLRAVRLSLAQEKQFRIQLRALLQASTDKNLEILLPMISDVAEIRRTKEILLEEKARLRRKKVAFGNPRLGVMIEVPSAVLMIEEIAAEVDFFNLGTNDLVQYLLAVDRDNEAVANWFRTLHPAILKAIKRVVDASEKFNKPLLICGEMAGSLVYAPILLGLGVRELSMNFNSIPRIRQIISKIAYEEAREIVKSLENCRTADEIEDKVRESLLSKWGHLYPADIFPPKKA